MALSFNAMGTGNAVNKLASGAGQVMKILGLILFLLFSVLICSTTQAVEFGGIKGQVNFCEQGGLDGMSIYIPGRQYSVITDNSGRFEINFIPTGKYDLDFRYNEKHLHQSSGILVNSNAVTNMNIIAICNPALKSALGTRPPAITAPSAFDSGIGVDASFDMDNDGSPLAKDCDDSDAEVKPGAIEICDGKDNNCNGSIDEKSDYDVNNGQAKCAAGILEIQQCTSGFADCDKDPGNGCEIDINSDSDNCGACGNVCSVMDQCTAGMC